MTPEGERQQGRRGVGEDISFSTQKLPEIQRGIFISALCEK
jgi:hypothetical protein